MKKRKINFAILFTAFIFCMQPDAKAQQINHMENNPASKDSISAVLKNYFDGIYTGNVDALSQVYAKGTLLYGDVNGQPYQKTLDQYLDGVKNRQSPKDSGKPFKGEIISIHVINSIATAEVKVKMYAFNYHEFLSFHQLNGKWLIVNKMISDVQE